MRDIYQRLLRAGLAATLALPFLSALAVRADDWPQWRGPHRDGVWRETGILASFPPGGLKVHWRAPVGWGWSSPVVAQGRVYLTDCVPMLPKAQERLLCFDAATGQPLWSYSSDVTYAPNTFYVDKAGRPTTPGQTPAPTPVVHAGKVYAVGMLGQVLCFDALKGDVLWKKDLGKDYQLGEFPCPKTSPLIEGGLLILLLGGKPAACVVALDKDSGREVWTALAESVTNSSPLALTAGGKRQLIVWTQESVTSLDPATGKPHWRQRLVSTTEAAVSSPVAHDDLLLVGGLMFKLAPDKSAASVLWPEAKGESRRILSNTSTALVRGDYVFSAKSSGQFVCLEARTGKQVWETDKVTDLKGGASIHPTPNGDSVFLYTDRGELILAKLTPKGYHEVSRTRLLAPTYPFGGRKVAWPPAVYANRCVFARSDQELVCASLAAEP
jgi:outer membrane protein assembly factor BamB